MALFRDRCLLPHTHWTRGNAHRAHRRGDAHGTCGGRAGASVDSSEVEEVALAQSVRTNGQEPQQAPRTSADG